MLANFKSYYKKHSKVVMPTAIFGGFALDVITLNKIDQLFDNAVFIFHIIASLIVFTILYSENTSLGRRLKVSSNKAIYETILLFSFGALFSGFTIVYFRSGSIFSSWPFILTMFFLMVSVEVRKDYFRNKVFQFSIIYLSLFSYLVIFYSLIFKKIEDWVFVLSGTSSIVFAFIYIFLLRFIDKQKSKIFTFRLQRSATLIFLVLNIFYFTNIIPPVPLSLKFKAVYHDIQKLADGGYVGTYEVSKGLGIFRKRSHTVHRAADDSIYVFTEVYAPTRISTDIYHVWQKFENEKMGWVDIDKIKLSIVGGRDEGYRGYSSKTNLSDGRWRVKVENKRGQILGYINFKVINNIEPAYLYVEAL